MSASASGPSINGKVSEHHAAVGLASLNQWNRHHARLAAGAACYRSAFAEPGLAARLHAYPNTASNYALFDAPDADACRHVGRALADAAIESRLYEIDVDVGQRLPGRPGGEHALGRDRLDDLGQRTDGERVCVHEHDHVGIVVVVGAGA